LADAGAKPRTSLIGAGVVVIAVAITLILWLLVT
jgi:hypothetical protein